MEVIEGQIMFLLYVQLKQKPQIIVGTPGRILDMIQRKYLFTDKLNQLIIDENLDCFILWFQRYNI